MIKGFGINSFPRGWKVGLIMGGLMMDGGMNRTYVRMDKDEWMGRGINGGVDGKMNG